MLALAVRIALAATLLVAALSKLAAPAATRGALATFGIRGKRLQWGVWLATVAGELGLAWAVLAGSDAGAYAAAALQLTLAAALLFALLAGRAGAPCGCFGARSRVRPAALGRNLALAAGFALVPALPTDSVSSDDWIAVGLVVALAACAILTVAVLALAREVGELRLALGPQAALELAGEGPELGGRSTIIERFDIEAGVRLALAVFTSDGCPACASLEPAVRVLDGDPLVAVRTFEEGSDRDVWDALAVPGAPYALALALDGTVLAKGTFNTLRQLESILGAAERRAIGSEAERRVGDARRAVRERTHA